MTKSEEIKILKDKISANDKAWQELSAYIDGAHTTAMRLDVQMKERYVMHLKEKVNQLKPAK